MADLGLNKVGDEQLLELLNEVVAELLSRDPIMHRVAYDGVLSLEKKRAIFMDLVKEEVIQATNIYTDYLRNTVRSEILEEVKSGNLNIPGMVPEAAVIVDEYRATLAEITAELTQMPADCNFSVTFKGRSLKYSYTKHDGSVWDGNRKTVPMSFAINVRDAIIRAAGLPA